MIVQLTESLKRVKNPCGVVVIMEVYVGVQCMSRTVEVSIRSQHPEGS